MPKWPTLSCRLAFITTLIISIIIYAALAVLAWVGYYLNESLAEIPSQIFESLIQVIAMLFGFTLIVIFYYQGKIHEHKKATLEAFLDFMEGPNEILSMMTKYAELLRRINNLMPPAILKGWFSDSLLKYEQNTEALRSELQSNYHGLVDSFEKSASSVISNTLVLILFFSFSLYVCFNGLFYSASEDEGKGWFYIALALMSITSAMLYFVSTWSKLQTLSDDLDNEFLKLSTVARIFGKKVDDIGS